MPTALLLALAMTVAPKKIPQHRRPPRHSLCGYSIIRAQLTAPKPAPPSPAR